MQDDICATSFIFVYWLLFVWQLSVFWSESKLQAWKCRSVCRIRTIQTPSRKLLACLRARLSLRAVWRSTSPSTLYLWTLRSRSVSPWQLYLRLATPAFLAPALLHSRSARVCVCVCVVFMSNHYYRCVCVCLFGFWLCACECLCVYFSAGGLQFSEHIEQHQLCLVFTGSHYRHMSVHVYVHFIESYMPCLLINAHTNVHIWHAHT